MWSALPNLTSSILLRLLSIKMWLSRAFSWMFSNLGWTQWTQHHHGVMKFIAESGAVDLWWAAAFRGRQTTSHNRFSAFSLASIQSGSTLFLLCALSSLWLCGTVCVCRWSHEVDVVVGWKGDRGKSRFSFFYLCFGADLNLLNEENWFLSKVVKPTIQKKKNVMKSELVST